MDWEDCLLKDPATKLPFEGQIASLQCIPTLFSNIVSSALIFAGGIALLFLIVAGFKYINSGGDPKQLDGARKTATYAIIGLLLVLFSFAIVTFVSEFTGADCITTFAFDSCAPPATP